MRELRAWEGEKIELCIVSVQSIDKNEWTFSLEKGAGSADVGVVSMTVSKLYVHFLPR